MDAGSVFGEVLDADSAPMGSTNWAKDGGASCTGNIESQNQAHSSSDGFLQVEISESTTDQDKVLYVVKTKTSLPAFSGKEFKVCRQHEEFVWLHDQLADNQEYSCYLIPPAPPRPAFESMREKLYRLGLNDSTFTKEDHIKIKSEVEADYLAVFKKTVTLHEVFLKRLAMHPKLRTDRNFVVFLEYDNDLQVRTKNTKEKAFALLKSVTQHADENIINQTVKDTDEYFLGQRTKLHAYHDAVKSASSACEAVVKHREAELQHMLRSQTTFAEMASPPSNATDMVANASVLKLLESFSEFFRERKKLESKIVNDEDLTLNDTLKYYTHETEAAKNLLYTRARLLQDCETARKRLLTAQAKRRNVDSSEQHQKQIQEKLEKNSEIAKSEFKVYTDERSKHYSKQLREMAALQVDNTKQYISMLQRTLEAVKAIEYDEAPVMA